MLSYRKYLANLFYAASNKNVIRYMKELEQLQWLSHNEIHALQRNQLQQVLEYANKHIPYYKDIFTKVGFNPAAFSDDPTSFQKLPLLTKSLIRENRDRLITAEAAKQHALYTQKSGGTTGEPLWFTKDDLYRDYNIAHDYHVMTWSGWQLGQPQYWLWGHTPSITQVKHSPINTFKNWFISRFDSNAFVLTPESMDAFATTLENNPGGVLWSYVSIVHRFAQFLQERGHRIRLRAIYTAAEPLFEQQRQYLQEVLACPVFNNYSSIDTGDIAVECEQHNGLHILSRNCYVEVLRDGHPVPDGEEGEFILTTLTNYGAPLIRYKIEDWGRKSSRQCTCGRGLPLLEVVEGRTIDLFKTKDGKTVYGAFADPLMPLLQGVKQFQVIQKSLDLVIFRMLQDSSVDQQNLQYIKDVAQNILGQNVEIKFEFVDSLPTTPTGKHRFLISEVS